MPIVSVVYLDEVVKERITGMIQEVATALDVPLRGVYTYWTEKPIFPFCWLYPGESVEERTSTTTTIERYTIYARFVLGHQRDRIDGKWADALWTFLPTLRRYFRERRNLVYRDGQDIPANLKSADLGAFSPFGVFDDGTEHVGFETPIILTFLAGHSPVMINL